MPQSILPARTDVTLALMLAELLAMLSRPDFRKQVRVAQWAIALARNSRSERTYTRRFSVSYNDNLAAR